MFRNSVRYCILCIVNGDDALIFCEIPNKGHQCGKCRACRARLVNEKLILSSFAVSEYRKKGQFLTFTYDDKYLPFGLKHEDYAGMMKRLRRRYDEPGIKLFMAGEYGEKSGREHFHALVYNFKYDLADIQNSWDKGYVYDGTLTPKSIKYVNGYVCKRGYDPALGKRAPYGRHSVNLPDGLLPDEVTEICMKGYVLYQGKRYAVPRNWRYRYRDQWKLFEKYRENKRYERFIFGDVKSLSPDYVTGLMDDRELRRLVRKGSLNV